MGDGAEKQRWFLLLDAGSAQRGNEVVETKVDTQAFVGHGIPLHDIVAGR